MLKAVAGILGESLHGLFCRRDALSSEDALNLASFLGEQLHNLHLLPVPSPSPNDSILVVRENYMQPSQGNGFSENGIEHPSEWELFVSILNRKRKDVTKRLSEWYERLSIISMQNSGLP